MMEDRIFARHFCPTRRRGRGLLAALLVMAAVTAAGASAPAATGAPRVVVTLKPIHALVAGVMAGVGTPALLIRGAASPHDYAMRPSETRLLHRADVIFWTGGAAETFLARTLQGLSKDVRVVALEDSPGLTLLRPRKGGAWSAPAARPADHRSEHRDAHDPHFWLDPSNAAAIVGAAARVLADADPDHAEQYARNRDAVLRRLDSVAREIEERLAPVRTLPYVVFHDAYQYFERRFGTHVIGALASQHAVRPGAQRLVEMRRKIAATGAVCVFSEPQFTPALVATLIEGSAARAGTLDPLGATLEPGPDAYFQLLRGLADDLRRCLGPPA